VQGPEIHEISLVDTPIK